jgi:hypothetical protein
VILDLVQTILPAELFFGEGSRRVLLVGKYEYGDILEILNEGGST